MSSENEHFLYRYEATTDKNTYFLRVLFIEDNKPKTSITRQEGYRNAWLRSGPLAYCSSALVTDHNQHEGSAMSSYSLSRKKY